MADKPEREDGPHTLAQEWQYLRETVLDDIPDNALLTTLQRCFYAGASIVFVNVSEATHKQGPLVGMKTIDALREESLDFLKKLVAAH